MRSRTALITAIVFFITYGLASTVGSIFLVTWGGKSWFKTLIIFLTTFPLDWDHLIVGKFGINLLLNVIFWSTVVYFIVLSMEKMIRLYRSSGNDSSS